MPLSLKCVRVPSVPLATEYKHAYSATLDDARMILKRLRKIAKPLGYATAVYGSTVLEGTGHDIDVQLMGSDDQLVTPGELGLHVVVQHAKELHMWEQKEKGDMQDVWLVMVTHDKLYLDIHIKGGK